MTPIPPPAVRLAVLAPAAMHTAMVRVACARGGVARGALGAADALPHRSRVAGPDGGVTVHVDRCATDVEAAAEEAEALVIDFQGIEHLEQVASRVRAALAASDRTIDQLRIIVRLAVVGAPTFGAAEQLADELGLEPRAREHALVGSFDAVAAVLASLAKHGAVDAIDLSPVLGAGAASDAVITGIADAVVPRLAVLASLIEPDVRGGVRATLALPAVPVRRAGGRVPFAAFETEVPTGF